MTMIAIDTEFGANDPIADPAAHAAMLEDYARHPEWVIRLAFAAFVVWSAGMAVWA